MFPYSGGPRAQIFRSEDIQKGQFDRALIRIFIKKNRKRGLAPGFVGFSKLSTAKGKDRAGASVGQRRSILKRRENERDTRSKQFYNTGRRCDIAPSCFLLSGKGPRCSLSLSLSFARSPSPTLSFSLSSTFLHLRPLSIGSAVPQSVFHLYGRTTLNTTTNTNTLPFCW